MNSATQLDSFENRYIPDLIKGDLDSLRSDVREYYEAKVRYALDFSVVFDCSANTIFDLRGRVYL